MNSEQCMYIYTSIVALSTCDSSSHHAPRLHAYHDATSENTIDILHRPSASHKYKRARAFSAFLLMIPDGQCAPGSLHTPSGQMLLRQTSLAFRHWRARPRWRCCTNAIERRQPRVDLSLSRQAYHIGGADVVQPTLLRWVQLPALCTGSSCSSSHCSVRCTGLVLSCPDGHGDELAMRMARDGSPSLVAGQDDITYARQIFRHPLARTPRFPSSLGYRAFVSAPVCILLIAACCLSACLSSRPRRDRLLFRFFCTIHDR
ncbi:hypothetical protein FKP32DRAFT_1228002 [Trametes sanguinea]|nr:hypothetical protein FKP32DRAFT_1228002 [Trametes sanguinea]